MRKTITDMDIPALEKVIYCYSYHRISTMRQLSGDGIRRQIEASQKVCNAKGWMMDTSFKLTDIGKSAYHGKNLDDKAALGSFLNAVDAGLIRRPAILLVESLDRLSRANIMDALELFIRIMNAGITIYTSIDDMTYNREDIQKNFSPLLISITLMCRSHEESETKSKRIKHSLLRMEQDLREGKLGRSTIYPFWIDISSGAPKVIKAQAQIVQDVFRLSANENKSVVDITNYLREKYDGMYVASVSKTQRLLYNKKVLGLYEAKDKSYIKAFPAIIDEKTYFLSQSMIAKRKIKDVGRPAKRAINFLKSSMKCGVCGRGIVLIGRDIGSGYVCHSYIEKNKCGLKSFLSAEKLMNAILYTLSLIDKDDMLEKAANTEKSKLSKLLNIKEAELREKQERLANLVDLIASGSKIGVDVANKTESQIDNIVHETDQIKHKLEMLNSPSLAGSIDSINAFHRRFILKKAERKDQQPFLSALNATVSNIVIHSPSDDLRSIIKIYLHSGIVLKMKIEKNYSTNVYKGSKRIGRYHAPPKKNRKLKNTSQAI